MQPLAALSIGSKIPTGNFESVVTGSFDRTCNLTVSDGSILTCATLDYFDMPRGIITDTPEDFKFSQIVTGDTAAHCRSGILRFSNSDLKIDLRGAIVWQPDFTTRTKPSELLIAKLWSEIDLGAYKSLLIDWVQGTAEMPIQGLIGRGPGLTPLGDDILTGMLSALSLLGIPYKSIAQVLPLTNDISRQMLNDASNGLVIEPIVAVLSALYTNRPIESSLENIRAVGSTSGTAMLIGLLAGIAHVEHYTLAIAN